MNLDQAHGLRTSCETNGSLEQGRPNVVGIVSGKGGVGKSTLAVNLAVACAKLGRRTLLIDGDSGLANADLLLGLIPEFSLADWCRGDVELQNVGAWSVEGLQLIPIGTGAEPVDRIRGALCGQSSFGLDQLLGAQDLTFLDLGAGIGTDVLGLAQHCHPVWLVMTPEPTSLADAYTTARRLWNRQPDLRIEVVVNRAKAFEDGQRAWQSLRRLTRRFLDRDIPLRSVLPDDPAMGHSVAHQSPVVVAASTSAIARKLCLLAESLSEERRAQAGEAWSPRPELTRRASRTVPG